MTEKTTTPKRLRAVKSFDPIWAGLLCTRDGQPVRIISREGRGQYPILGYIADSIGICDWTSRGSYTRHFKGEHPKDLMCAEEVVASPELPERWVVYCRTEDSHVLLWSSHADRESAECALTMARTNRTTGSFHLYRAAPVADAAVTK